ncbi:MAG: cobaltochelatase subunit CobT [Alphaproteobacteria bacterium]|nr:cobaltochelatase subunit CobT [Alphaproteobacteria bacterium]
MAAAKALARNRDLTISFGADMPTLQGTRARLPLPARELPRRDVSRVRGAADAFSLRLRLHDRRIHAAHMPNGGPARAVYDAVEQARIEAIGATRMAGVAQNLDAAAEDYCTRRGFARVQNVSDAPVADAVRFLLRERLTGAPPPKAARTMVDLWRRLIQERAGADLDALAGVMADQRAFARLARRLIADLDLWEEEAENPELEAGEQEDEENEQDGEGENKDGSRAGSESGAADEQELTEAARDQDAAVQEAAAADQQPRGAGEEEPGGARQPWWPEGFPNTNTGEPPYRPFTTEFDEVVNASELCEPEELLQLRNHLDQQIHHLQGVVARLANRLQRRLLAKQNRSWEFDLDEGVLDAARLARVIANPMNPLSYKMEKQTEFRDTVVTLLLDNSGSMRGRPIGVAAMCADVLARTLERCGVSVEILGFTTRAWKGGQARERWIAAGKPNGPGRLNDLRHIVYKSADAPWRRTRRNLGLMMREGLLKENIDGEALLWAHARLMARPVQRRILMVISDGAPVDDSTLSVNRGNYLDRHLHQVIQWIQSRSPVELIAIGIGHDVARYYKRAVTIVDVDQLGGAMIDQLADLFDEEGPADRRRGPAGARRPQPQPRSTLRH